MSTELVRVDGLKELREALLKKIPQEMQGKALQPALAQGARPIVATARQLAPEKTGTLRCAIFSFRDKKQSTRTLEVRSIVPRSGKRLQKRGLDAFYWKFVEFGHRTGARKGQYLKKLDGRRSHGKAAEATGVVPPRPFMRPAFESQKHAALAAIVDGMKRQLERATKYARWGTPKQRAAVRESRAAEIGEIFSGID